MFLTKKKRISLLLGFGIFFIGFPAILVNFKTAEELYIVLIEPPDLLKPSKVSGTILINGTSDWIDFRNKGNCTGSGTYMDPYVIKDLVIDGQGTESCIWIQNTDVYFRIENCSLFNALNTSEFSTPKAGIMLYNTSNGSVKQVNCTSNMYGIVSLGHNNSISECNIFDNLGGIYASETYSYPELYGNQNISENIIINNGGGIGLIYINNSHIKANYISDNWYGGVFMYLCDYISFFDNSVNNNNETGIQLEHSDFNIFYNNTCNNNNGTGIRLITSSSNFISDNEINNNGLIGIEFVLSSDENRIVNNMINDNLRGIYFEDWNENNRITDNNINNNKEIGIEANRTNNNLISNNVINGGYYGIKLFESNNFDILQNTINNHEYGIYLTSSHSNEIIGNTLHYNGACITESNQCNGNVYEDNSCIEGIFAEWVIPVIVTVVSVVALVVLIYFLARHKKSN